MKNVAICYWGLTRSTKKVYESHKNNLFDVLKNNNITYDTYMHTWKTNNNFIWDKKSSVPIDYDEYKLLEPNYYEIDDQDLYLNSLTFSSYFKVELYVKYGGNTDKEWHPMLIRNHLCALESQKRVTDMVLKSGIKYDYILYIRPDVMITSLFDKKFFLFNKKTITICNCDHFSGYSDLFAILHYDDCEKYGKRIDEIIEFRKTNGRITSEKYVKFITDKYFDNVNFVEFIFHIVRP
jgi:hypothetical protein